MSTDSADLGALAAYKTILEEAKKKNRQTIREQTPDGMGPKLLIASTALHAYRKRHLGTLMRCVKHGSLLKNCFDPNSFESVDIQKLKQIIMILNRQNLAGRDSEITNLHWTQKRKDNA